MPFINRCGGGSVVGTTLKDVMDQIVSYKSVITVNGEERSNLLVQPSDFSTQNYLEPNTSYADISIVEDADAEDGSALLVANSGQGNSGSANYRYDRLAYETTIPNTAGGGAYLVVMRAKATSYTRSQSSALGIHPYYVPIGQAYEGSVGHSSTAFFTRVTTSYRQYFFLVNINDSAYLQRVLLSVTMQASTSGTNPRPDYYIDWLSVYDVSGIDLTAYDALIQSAY